MVQTFRVILPLRYSSTSICPRKAIVRRISYQSIACQRISPCFKRTSLRSNSQGSSCSGTFSSQGLEEPKNQAVIVEGLADKRAVQRAVPFAIFVLGSSTWVEGKNSATVLSNLAQGIPRFQRLTVLLDPDFAGRKGRNILETTFPGKLWHAFIPAAQATSSKDTRWHEKGNVGVEHAPPESIRNALANSRLATPGRTHFTKEKLIDLGLAASFDDPKAGNIRVKRDLVCNALGVGICDGKQLLRQLNIYNFTERDLSRAIESIDSQLVIQRSGTKSS